MNTTEIPHTGRVTLWPDTDDWESFYFWYYLARRFSVIVDFIGIPLSCLGFVNNILVLMVFFKMGYKETSNISLTVIGIWDLARCIIAVTELGNDRIPSLWGSLIRYICNRLYLTVVNMALVNSAYIALERCLCVTLPFTVKYLLTKKVVITTTIVLSTLVPLSTAHFYLTYHFVTNINIYNVTSKHLLQTPLSKKYPYLRISTYIIEAAIPIVTGIITSVCTFITVYELKKIGKIRSELISATTAALMTTTAAMTTNNRNGNGNINSKNNNGNSNINGNNNNSNNNSNGRFSNIQSPPPQQRPQTNGTTAVVKETSVTEKNRILLSTRDRKISRMLVTVNIIFIICDIPILADNFMKLIRLSPYSSAFNSYAYNAVWRIVFDIRVIFDLFNSCVNFFVFLVMSAEFKVTLKSLFRIQNRRSKK